MKLNWKILVSLLSVLCLNTLALDTSLALAEQATSDQANDIKAVAEPVSEAVAEPVSEAVAEPVSEAVAEPVSEAVDAVDAVDTSDAANTTKAVVANEDAQATTFKRNTGREFFDDQTTKVWQYIRPVVFIRTGVIYEQWDETNRVLRKAGFKIWDAKLGFKGNLDSYSINSKWKAKLSYKAVVNFASGAKLDDMYVAGEINSYIFSTRLKLGNMKVPFLHGETESTSKLYFTDNPQYVKPYGSKYLPVTIGLGRNHGATLRFGFLDNALTLEGGMFSPANPKEEVWATTIYSVKAKFDSKKMIHKKVRLQLGTGFVYQEKLPQYFENERYIYSADARLFVWGAFLGGEWVLQEMNDGIKIAEYERLGYENSWTSAMGYSVFAGYSFPNREYELAVRYQWFDPDSTNVDQPLPQSGNQALRWVTVSASWWPIDLVRVMVNYTHKWELEAVATSEYTEARLKDVKNDTALFLLQLSL